MPDADDFDVEYFRNLLKGDGAQAPLEPPAAGSLSPAKPKKRPAARASAPRGKGKPKTGRK